MCVIRNSYKGIILAIAGFFLSQSGYSQQLPVYSQYMMNKFLINPAVAGSEGYTSFNLTAREQWIGLHPELMHLLHKPGYLKTVLFLKALPLEENVKPRQEAVRLVLEDTCFQIIRDWSAEQGCN